MAGRQPCTAVVLDRGRSTLAGACSCFTSPLDRARETAELIWQEREGPVVSIEPLGEANLGWLEGMTNGELKRAPHQLCPDPCCCSMPAASSVLPVGFQSGVAEPVPLLGMRFSASASPCSKFD